RLGQQVQLLLWRWPELDPDHGAGHPIQRYRVHSGPPARPGHDADGPRVLVEVSDPPPGRPVGAVDVEQVDLASAGTGPVTGVLQRRVDAPAGDLQRDRLARSPPLLGEGVEIDGEFGEIVEGDAGVPVHDDRHVPRGRTGVLPEVLEVEAAVRDRLAYMGPVGLGDDHCAPGVRAGGFRSGTRTGRITVPPRRPLLRPLAGCRSAP